MWFRGANTLSAAANIYGPLQPTNRVSQRVQSIEMTTAQPRCDVRARAATKVAVTPRANPMCAVHPCCCVSQANDLLVASESREGSFALISVSLDEARDMHEHTRVTVRAGVQVGMRPKQAARLGGPRLQ